MLGLCEGKWNLQYSAFDRAVYLLVPAKLKAYAGEFSAGLETQRFCSRTACRVHHADEPGRTVFVLPVLRRFVR